MKINQKLFRYEIGERSCFLLIAEDEDFSAKIVGTITVTIYDRYAWISYFAVDVVYRRRGIGSAILERAVDVANKYYAIETFNLSCDKNNKDLLTLYRRHNFYITGGSGDKSIRLSKTI